MRRIRNVIIALMLSVGCGLGALLRHGVTPLDPTPLEVTPGVARGWDEVLAAPSDLRVRALVTGFATGDRAVVMDPDDPELGRLTRRDAPSPVLAYALTSPDGSVELIDAGLSRAHAEGGGGNYTALLRGLLFAMGSETRQRARQAAVEQLRARRPARVWLTHLHADHTSGVADLPCEVPVVFGVGESTFLSRALMGPHLACHEARTLDLSRAPAMPPFEHALDLRGDGSFWALATPGHTAGHLSYLVVTSDGPWLITGDAAAYHDQLRHRIRPAPGVYDPAAAARSLERLATFVERHPGLRVAPGHETPRPR